MADTGTPIEGAVALVTGGNRGLGKALVAELLARGASKVYASARNPFTAEDPRVVPLTLDVTDDAAVKRAAEIASDVSIVINNAGVTLRTPLLDAPFDQIQAELETNLFGVLRVTRAFAPALAEHDRSAVVNVLSVLSWISFGSGYEVSKAAAWSATNALRVALHGQGTTVTAVHVGYMDTDMAAGVDAPKLDPRDVAKLTVDAIVNGDYEVLADDISRQVKAGLAAPVEALYEQLAVSA
jgi:NAD(P)-dependent dehydrogenase (short-subunit alcohol dehydrogenase family)